LLIGVVIWHWNVCPPAPKGKSACAKGRVTVILGSSKLPIVDFSEDDLPVGLKL
jgi:hypothetical protein